MKRAYMILEVGCAAWLAIMGLQACAHIRSHKPLVVSCQLVNGTWDLQTHVTEFHHNPETGVTTGFGDNGSFSYRAQHCTWQEYK